MGFFFVRRSRYEALAREMYKWEVEVARLDVKLARYEKQLERIRRVLDGDRESVLEEER